MVYTESVNVIEYDAETGFYHLQSRQYDPQTGRFINADNQVSIGNDLTATNLFAYCGNNPIMRTDTTGHKWWHWALGAIVVAACAAATVVTAGGFAAGMAAVAAVGSGVTAATTASTVAAAAFIGSATYLGVSAMNAAATSSSVSEFCDQGNWLTVAGTVGSAAFAGASAYASTRGSSTPKTSSKSVGKPFDPKGSKVQIGVDPKTLTPSKNLATLDTYRLKNAEIYGREQALSVYRTGVIEDGNHRLANALANNRSVDVVIFP